MDAQVKTVCTPAPCTHNISTFPFPLQIPTFPLTCSLNKEAIAASQETKGDRKSDWPAAYWLLASKKVKQMDLQATCAESDWNTADLLAEHHFWTTAKFISPWQLKHYLWMLLGLIRALPQCQHTATLPVPTSISPNPLQSLGMCPIPA